MSDKKWLIYSIAHREGDIALWYSHDMNGYTKNVFHAGRYTYEEAENKRNGCEGHIDIIHIDTVCRVNIVVTNEDVVEGIKLSKGKE